MSGSGISWAICNSALCSRQITMPAPHHSVFYRLDALPAAQPTASKHLILIPATTHSKLAISGIDTLSLDPSIKKMILTPPYKSYLYVDAFVTIALYCTYMCMNFVHTVVFYNCRYRYCYLQFVAIAFYCTYMFMNFVHSCV